MSILVGFLSIPAGFRGFRPESVEEWKVLLMSLKDLFGRRERKQRIKIISQGSFVQEV